MKRLKKVVVYGTVALGLLIGVAAFTEVASAETGHGYHKCHPHPHLLDEWEWGITDNNYAYSYYFMKADHWGSIATVTDIFGNHKSRDSRKYGCAKAGEYKQLWWVRADSW